MEIGYVDFFNNRDDKLYGFIESEKGRFFFHFSNGCAVVLDERQNISFKPVPPRMPKKGDEVRFRPGRNAQGPKATAWCFGYEYDEMVEKRKRDLTLAEAGTILGNAVAKVLKYTNTARDWIGTTVTETTSITWHDGSAQIGEGEFVRTFGRHENAGEVKNVLRHTTARVSLCSPNRQDYHDSVFGEAHAEALKELGRERQVREGIYQHVTWNGGGDGFVVDPTSVRDMTAEDLAATSGYSPWLGNYAWLKCSFAKHLGAENQVVKIIAYLGGGE